MHSGDIIDRKKFESKEVVGSGNYGTVYRYDDDKVIKFANSRGDSNQYNAVSIIKNLSLPNFYKLYDVLSCTDGDVKTFGGTIARYYPSEDLDLFLMPSDYLLDNFNSLYNSMVLLGSSKISIFDLNPRNVICNSSGIYVIDVDLYQQMMAAFPWDLSMRNCFALKRCLFYDLLLRNYFRHHFGEVEGSKSKLVDDAIYDLLNLSNKEDPMVFNATLSEYRYPIDYVKRKVR
jgi:hypothetical protein